MKIYGECEKSSPLYLILYFKVGLILKIGTFLQSEWTHSKPINFFYIVKHSLDLFRFYKIEYIYIKVAIICMIIEKIINIKDIMNRYA